MGLIRFTLCVAIVGGTSLASGIAGAQANFDVLADGKGFVMIQPTQAADEQTQINVVLNWAHELRQRDKNRQ